MREEARQTHPAIRRRGHFGTLIKNTEIDKMLEKAKTDVARITF